VRFLLEERFRISREDLQLFYSTYNWPYNVKMYMTRSNELQTGRRKDLEMLLEGRLENLNRELSNSEKKVEKLFELGSLQPLEVSNMVKRITAIREGLEEAESEADNIEEQVRLPKALAMHD
jgi:dynein heavy chain